jgi:hypothetical protein
VDAEASPRVRARLSAAHGIQVLPPPLARMLYAFGPADAMSKPDLLRALRESLDSYDLTHDRRGLLRLVLQIAVTSTGADRGSLMLWDERERVLRVEVAIGIEDEVIPKIRVQPGEGIAGRAFAAERSILLHGKADRTRFDIVRERDDVESRSCRSPRRSHDRRTEPVARAIRTSSATELEPVDELATRRAHHRARRGVPRSDARIADAARRDRREPAARDEPLAPSRVRVYGPRAGSRGGQLYLRGSESSRCCCRPPRRRSTLTARASALRAGPAGPRRRCAPRGRPRQWHRRRRAHTAIPLLAGEEVVGYCWRRRAARDRRSRVGHGAPAGPMALADELAGALRFGAHGTRFASRVRLAGHRRAPPAGRTGSRRR